MKEIIKRANDLKLFDNQPELNEKEYERLQKIGLVRTQKFSRPVTFTKNKGKKTKVEISHKRPGEVVSFVPLSDYIRKNGISQDDAKRLIMIETICSPRETHITMLMIKAFCEDKEKVYRRIEKACKQKVK